MALPRMLHLNYGVISLSKTSATDDIYGYKKIKKIVPINFNSIETYHGVYLTPLMKCYIFWQAWLNSLKPAIMKWNLNQCRTWLYVIHEVIMGMTDFVQYDILFSYFRYNVNSTRHLELVLQYSNKWPTLAHAFCVEEQCPCRCKHGESIYLYINIKQRHFWRQVICLMNMFCPIPQLWNTCRAML